MKIRRHRPQWYCAAVCACLVLTAIPAQSQTSDFAQMHPDWSNDLNDVYEPADAVARMLSGVRDFLPGTWAIILMPYDQKQSEFVDVVFVSHYTLGAVDVTPAERERTDLLLANKLYCDGRASLKLKPAFGGHVGHFVANPQIPLTATANTDPLVPFPPCVQLSTTDGLADLFKTPGSGDGHGTVAGKAVKVVQSDLLTTLQAQVKSLQDRVDQLQHAVYKLRPIPTNHQAR